MLFHIIGDVATDVTCVESEVDLFDTWVEVGMGLEERNVEPVHQVLVSY